MIQTSVGSDDYNMCATEVFDNQNTPYEEKTHNSMEDYNKKSLCVDSVKCRNGK
jgi:hypothetical protein